MYEEHWKLKEKPFENTPDPRFLYRSSQHDEGLARLLYAVQERRPAVLLTGVFGCGKTLLSRGLFAELNSNVYQTAYVPNPHYNPVELLRAIARSLGAENLPIKLTEMSSDYFLEVIGSILQNNEKDGKKTVLVVDEAHTLSKPEIFEELRMLLNFQEETHPWFTLVLMGQPELKERVQKHKQFLQRIPIAFHLGPLELKQVGEYVKHRWNVAAESAHPFTQDAITAIYENSGGIPRRINQICDMALMVGFYGGLKSIDGNAIMEAATGQGV